MSSNHITQSLCTRPLPQSLHNTKQLAHSEQQQSIRYCSIEGCFVTSWAAVIKVTGTKNWSIHLIGSALCQYSPHELP